MHLLAFLVQLKKENNGKNVLGKITFLGGRLLC